MAVAVVSTGTATYNSSATTQTYSFTVAAGSTLAVFFIVQDATQSITSVTWDQGATNQACTLVGSKSCPTATNGAVYIYAVVNPTTGGTAKTLQVINGTATGTSVEMQSYSGTATSSVSAACTHVLTANGSAIGSTNGTAAQTGASGDMYVSAYVCGLINSVSDTQIYLLSPAGDDAAGNRFPSVGASHTLSANTGGSPADWAAVSLDIAQPAASNAPFLGVYDLPRQPYRPDETWTNQGKLILNQSLMAQIVT